LDDNNITVNMRFSDQAKARASEVFHNQSQLYEANVAAMQGNFFPFEKNRSEKFEHACLKYRRWE
jgi:hypothetical protein